jgi:hypothetical protein
MSQTSFNGTHSTPPLSHNNLYMDLETSTLAA